MTTSLHKEWNKYALFKCGDLLGDKDDKRMKFLSVSPCIYHVASQCSLMKYSNYDKK